MVLSSFHVHTDCLALGGTCAVCCSPPVIRPTPSQDRLNCQLLSSIKNTWIRPIRGNWTCFLLFCFSAVSAGVYSCHLYFPCKWTVIMDRQNFASTSVSTQGALCWVSHRHAWLVLAERKNYIYHQTNEIGKAGLHK